MTPQRSHEINGRHAAFAANRTRGMLHFRDGSLPVNPGCPSLGDKRVTDEEEKL